MSGSIKVVLDATGNPWLVVGTATGHYEAVQVNVKERHVFDFSYEAVKYAKQQNTPVDEAWQAVRS